MGTLLMGHSSFPGMLVPQSPWRFMYLLLLFLKIVIPVAIPSLTGCFPAGKRISFYSFADSNSCASNYPSDTLQAKMICFDGTRQEHHMNSSRWRVLAQASLRAAARRCRHAGAAY